MFILKKDNIELDKVVKIMSKFKQEHPKDEKLLNEVENQIIKECIYDER